MESEAERSGQPDKAGSKFRLRRGFKFPRTWSEVKKLGWKVIVAFVIFYLIRDSLLYILLPYLLYKGIISF